MQKINLNVTSQHYTCGSKVLLKLQLNATLSHMPVTSTLKVKVENDLKVMQCVDVPLKSLHQESPSLVKLTHEMKLFRCLSSKNYPVKVQLFDSQRYVESNIVVVY